MIKLIRKGESVNVARDRMHAILSADRLHCSNEQIKEMEMDILRTINKYVITCPTKVNTRVVHKEGNDELMLVIEATISR